MKSRLPHIHEKQNHEVPWCVAISSEIDILHPLKKEGHEAPPFGLMGSLRRDKLQRGLRPEQLPGRSRNQHSCQEEV